MIDITTIPTQELLKDKADSIIDIEVCKDAILLGVMVYNRYLVQERLDNNRMFVRRIDKELKRRGGNDDNDKSV